MTDRTTITRRSAERALDRTGASGSAEVDATLRFATAPASNLELNGEAGAVALFKAYNPPVPVAAPVVARPRRRRVRLVAALAACGVLFTGGFAWAAVEGKLPDAVPLIGGERTHHPSTPSTSPSARASGGPRVSAPPAIRSLCRQYDAASASGRAALLDSPRFSRVVRAAGGVGKVDAYCGAVKAGSGTAPTTGPTGSVDPTPGDGSATPADPTGTETDDPTDDPTDTSTPNGNNGNGNGNGQGNGKGNNGQGNANGNGNGQGNGNNGNGNGNGKGSGKG